MANIQIGMPITMGGKTYIAERITKRTESYITRQDSDELKARKLSHLVSVIYQKFEVDHDIDVEDTITETLEEVRFKDVENANPLTIVVQHTFKKETPYGQQRVEETSGTEADSSAAENGGCGPVC